MLNLGMGNVPSVADIAAVTDGNGRNNGWGDNSAWWVIILILAMCGGFGNGWGWGNNGNGGGTVAVDAALQRGFDTQAIISKLDGINSGICSLGYDQLAQMNGIQSTVMQTGFGITQAINADTVANMQNTNALSRQISDCCCENRAAVQDLKYTMATDTCAMKQAVADAANAIIQNDNNNFRVLNDQMMQDRLAAKDAQIRNLEQALNTCSRDTALQGLGSWIVSQVRPTAQPAWIVNNPYAQADCSVNQCCGRAC